MTIVRHDTKARMSRAVIHNGVGYLCGQVAGPDARHGDIAEQTRSMLERVEALLEEVGSDREHLLSATIYLKEGQDFAAMNAVWDAWVPEGHAPARTCITAPMPADELKVEITVTCAIKG
ncbi:Enamine deaminase RidA, house cleaning of reactive enamine intermediates, YjgF/YER057c/UK114 family [Onishia taeanensis]|jgi:enamine deaminase RidA (YjgF/YER057c/UK114 family)|uniref:Enamine deaminase RidA, house cleaning of reactive enamine intermediates, YjgF/YER057c/UK114 family n=1 Tax=Onishia taeanensis TaxID=284577 RepID=A0A1G7MWZ7_9GAMM|nr:RidA family protein [Halomonas taeanensis]MAX33488.1 RidA family protein [Halomonadaceae bacterium]SDF66232.1 Enamine deaminase RidA, house cleaning of reactive enamine intermediates, YjgF/YER057c/UK114 family [Halomonas taeanensis]